MFIDPKFDGNCCFSFLMNKKQTIVCETSSICIVKAKKLMKFSKKECSGAAAEGGKGG
jgi:hypothetical protein